MIGLDLLKKGYTLRGTLRNEKNATALTNGAYKDFQGRVELQIVSDMTADGAFDEAVKGSFFCLELFSFSSSTNPYLSHHLCLLP